MALAPPPLPACAAVTLAHVRAASGDHWNAIAQLTARGRATVSGLHGTARFDDDLRDGRTARRFSIAVMGPSAEIDDGRHWWSQDVSGGVHAYDAWFPRRRAITMEYLTRRAYLDPQPAARITCAGTRIEDGRAVTVLRIVPPGGTPAELAVDARTFLPASVSERLPTTTAVTRYNDYRTVGDVVLPFTIAAGTLHEPEDGYVFDVSRYTVRPSVHASDFTRPRPTGAPVMLGGARTASVPMVLDGAVMMVWASIDGHPPMLFILDTGGHAILTTQTATALGLRPAGAGVTGGSGAGTIAVQYARVRSIRLGAAELRDQPMLVIPYPPAFSDRGRGRAPIAGILGLEVFERFATRLDFHARRVTLTPLDAFAHRGSGSAVPIRFQEDMPLTEASADGHRGLFGVDTGNGGVLLLFGDFLRRTGMFARYPAGRVVIGHGTGGENTARIERLRRFALGGRTIDGMPCAFTDMKSGALSSWTEAGNLGVFVLSYFTPTFDYANGTLYLDPGSAPIGLRRR
ncbi:MAG TPA: pepsin/retropepsin-like aspartic protease family protein [Candidatus Sulfotelmatobacter sp.]|nr:pepsin/retropepsin-like aspartic protease family protein [Candidatus Sulfotelmatobacter sp.]